MDDKTNRRRIILINKKFQHKFIYNFILIISCCIIFTGILVAIYYYFKYQYGTSIFNNYLLVVSKGETIKVRTMFKIIAPIIAIVFAAAIIFLSVFISTYGLYYSHRIAGPIYRLRKTIESICNKDFNLIVRLRKKDKFKEIEDYLNNLIDFLNQETRIVNEHNNNISEKIKEIKNLLSSSPGDIKNINKKVNEIEKVNLALQKHLKEIKTKDTG